jgi:hypothetical protein
MPIRKKSMVSRLLRTGEDKERYEQGLRTLARLIVRVYLCNFGIRSGDKPLPEERPKC